MEWDGEVSMSITGWLSATLELRHRNGDVTIYCLEYADLGQIVGTVFHTTPTSKNVRPLTDNDLIELGHALSTTGWMPSFMHLQPRPPANSAPTRK